MFRYPDLDVTIERGVDASLLSWPGPRDATDDSGLGCNRQYVDLRGLSWREAKRVYRLEGELIARIEVSEAGDDECDVIEDELYESDENLYDLDIGVASTVIALSAARCVPFSSCNGGVFGGTHPEAYPLVAFFARQYMVPLLLSAATDADIGLVSDSDGYLVAHSGEIHKLRSFAASLIHERQSFRDSAPKKRQQNPQRHAGAEQFRLLQDEGAASPAE